LLRPKNSIKFNAVWLFFCQNSSDYELFSSDKNIALDTFEKSTNMAMGIFEKNTIKKIKKVTYCLTVSVIQQQLTKQYAATIS